ncbi:MAG: hypothetical protein ACR2JE_10620 [Acidobacteriaceae bacterium]
MRNQASTASFGLFVIVLLGAIYWLLHQHGRPQYGLVAVLVGILVLRAGLFLYNLQQQKKRLERGQTASIPKVGQRLGLDTADETTEADTERKRDDDIQ